MLVLEIKSLEIRRFFVERREEACGILSIKRRVLCVDLFIDAMIFCFTGGLGQDMTTETQCINSTLPINMN